MKKKSLSFYDTFYLFRISQLLSAQGIGKVVTTLFVGLFFSSQTAAQEPEIREGAVFANTISDSPLGMVTTPSSSEIPKQGTYQIMRIKGKPEDVVQQSSIDLIESYRRQNQIIYIKAGDNTWIKILPYNAILAPDFKPAPSVVYTDDSLSDN